MSPGGSRGTSRSPRRRRSPSLSRSPARRQRQTSRSPARRRRQTSRSQPREAEKKSLEPVEKEVKEPKKDKKSKKKTKKLKKIEKKAKKEAKKAKKAAKKLAKLQKSVGKSKKKKKSSDSDSSSSDSSDSSGIDFVMDMSFSTSGKELDPRNPEAKIQKALGLTCGAFSFVDREDDQKVYEDAKKEKLAEKFKGGEVTKNDWICLRANSSGEVCESRNFNKNERCFKCSGLRRKDAPTVATYKPNVIDGRKFKK
eukprot:TRINITY_DN32946_c0_g1_i1.p1 TRINITY_DN32946_c0_g1~~TRINITY_DN32946_c0_g1_i1.p1  ORF type:complete len:254 (-),score=69.89 TRINITY_DN32946_c0_g1_i1:64-825(-)